MTNLEKIAEMRRRMDDLIQYSPPLKGIMRALLSAIADQVDNRNNEMGVNEYLISLDKLASILRGQSGK